MRIRIATLTLACLLTATAAMAQQPPNTTNRAVSPPAPDGTLGMALLGAHVSSTGTLINSAGATGAQQISGFTGNYEVDFNRDVTTCFYNAVSFTNTVAVDVEPRSGNPNGVFVVFQTIDGAHTSTNSEFYLTVFCAR